MTVVVFSALVWAAIDWIRNLANFKTQRSAVVTQATAWLGGILLVWLGAHASATAALVLPGSSQPLGSLDFASVIIIGMLVSSLASTGVTIKQAIDRSDSAVKPPLIPPPGPPAEPAPAAPAAPVPATTNLYLTLSGATTVPPTEGAPPAG